jgi:hypothetical protein
MTIKPLLELEYGGVSVIDRRREGDVGRLAVDMPLQLHEFSDRLRGGRAGEGRLGMVFQQAGFKRFRRATETPFNLVLEARP